MNSVVVSSATGTFVHPFCVHNDQPFDANANANTLIKEYQNHTRHMFILRFITQMAESDLGKPFGRIVRDIELYTHLERCQIATSSSYVSARNIDIFGLNPNGTFADGKVAGGISALAIRNWLVTKYGNEHISPLSLNNSYYSSDWVWTLKILIPGIKVINLNIVSRRLAEEVKDAELSAMIWDMTVNCLMLGKYGYELIPQYVGCNLSVEQIKEQIVHKETSMNPSCVDNLFMFPKVVNILFKGWTICPFSRDDSNSGYETDFFIHHNRNTRKFCMISSKDWKERRNNANITIMFANVSFASSSIRKILQFIRSPHSSYQETSEDTDTDTDADADD
jgi:hypothetical protein